MDPMIGLTNRHIFQETRILFIRSFPEFEVAFADDVYSYDNIADILATFKAEITFRFIQCKLNLLIGE